MELGIDRGVERHVIVGHDTATAIDGAVLTERLVFQRVGKVDAVGIGEFTALQAVHHIHGIILVVALRIGFLDAAA